MLFTDRTAFDESDESKPFYRKLQWSIVGKASNEVKRQRKLRKAGLVGGDDGVVDGVLGQTLEFAPSDKSHSSAEHVDHKRSVWE